MGMESYNEHFQYYDWATSDNRRVSGFGATFAQILAYRLGLQIPASRCAKMAAGDNLS